MDSHPDFAESTLPSATQMGGFRLTPLDVAAVDEDFEAVTSSAAVLKGLFGDDWPVGLTRDDNLVDMGWHEREFTARRSFAWIIRDAGGVYLGCAYLYPEIGTTGRGQIVTWMCDTPQRLELLARFNREFAQWLLPFLPKAYKLSWVSNDSQ